MDLGMTVIVMALYGCATPIKGSHGSLQKLTAGTVSKDSTQALTCCIL